LYQTVKRYLFVGEAKESFAIAGLGKASLPDPLPDVFPGGGQTPLERQRPTSCHLRLEFDDLINVNALQKGVGSETAGRMETLEIDGTQS
jgi:hypothetical protein